MAAVCLAAGLFAGLGCDAFPMVAGEQSAAQRVGVDKGLVTLRVRNLSGISADVIETYEYLGKQVRLTNLHLPPFGPMSIADGIWTLADTITVRAVVAADGYETSSSRIQPGEELAIRVFRAGEDFSDGQVLVFDIPGPEAPPDEGNDCNHNGFNDLLETVSGASADCDSNNVPDECQSDADGDSIIDPCDGCPNDPEKSDPGLCGCGHADPLEGDSCDGLPNNPDDLDDDGISNDNDRCENTPAGEAANEIGCSCSQLDCDDHDPCTTDTCEAGVCTHSVNELDTQDCESFTGR
jgi:hypothetical protein